MAKLYFRYGAMNCGKSTSLLQVAYNYEERGMNIFIIKPGVDLKGDDKIVSRLGIIRKADMLTEKTDNLFSRIKEMHPLPDCVLVDEVQFMEKEHIDQLYSIAVEMDIPVICYGLRTDFLMNGFKGSERLLLIAHTLEELKTICSCGKKAVSNARKINGKFVFEGNQIAIDNSDEIEYEALCGECYLKKKREENERQ